MFVFKSPHISDPMQYLSLASWLISLSIMLSRFVHVVANGRVSVALTQKEFCFLLTQGQVQMCSREISTESFRDLSSIHLVVLMSPGGSEKGGLDPLHQVGQLKKKDRPSTGGLWGQV